MSFASYSFPTSITVGPGARRLLPDKLKARGAVRPLIVTDKALAALPLTSELQQLLATAGLEPRVYAGIEGNPVISHVDRGVEAYREHHADSVVALGGGAGMDVAKVVALMVNHPGELLDYEDGKPDGLPVDQPMPPIVALPTAAGTGSEVGRASVVSEDDTHIKRIIFAAALLPREVLVDPELTLRLPPKITAATGLDAITHLAEAYVAKGNHPMCDGIALQGLRLAAKSLPSSVRFAQRVVDDDAQLSADEHAAHIEAREQMMNAAMMGAVAFQKGLGVTHSCAHSLSTVCDLHHGLANGVLVPYTMSFNEQAVPDRLADMARAVGVDPRGGEGFVDWLRRLNEQVGIAATLGEVGVETRHIDDLIKFAHQDGCHAQNPRSVSLGDFRDLFAKAIG